jgi:DNA-binding CsgD family transcriptional regulator
MSKIDVAALNRLQTELGEVAIDASRWRDVLERLCLAVGAEGASLRQSGIRSADVPYTRSMEHLTRVYFRDEWNLRDTRVQVLGQRKVKSPAFSDFDMYTSEEIKTLFRRDAYYNDFLGLERLKWGAWMQFRIDGAPWMIALQRTEAQGYFEPRDVDLLRPLSHSLAEVANLSSSVGHVVLTGVLDALDLVRKPALALDRRGLVLGTNLAAQEIFDSSMRLANSRLIVSDDQARHRLDALYALLRTTPERSFPVVEPIVVKRFGKSPLVLEVLPVPVATRSPFLGARILLTVRDPTSVLLPRADILRDIYNLTIAETRLALRIATGESLETVACQLNISRETVRNQLKALFAKTDTHRQGELVALLARL